MLTRPKFEDGYMTVKRMNINKNTASEVVFWMMPETMASMYATYARVMKRSVAHQLVHDITISPDNTSHKVLKDFRVWRNNLRQEACPSPDGLTEQDFVRYVEHKYPER